MLEARLKWWDPQYYMTKPIQEEQMIDLWEVELHKDSVVAEDFQMGWRHKDLIEERQKIQIED